MKYLHEPTPGTIVLDHRLTPEVRAMLAAMVSRSPVGGMRQRYAEVVEAAGDEDALTTYPLPPKVQAFFDQFVGQYGHCYDDRTDVLARVNGCMSWRPWPKLCELHECGADVEVAAFDPALDGVRFEKPLAVIRKSYTGKMYRVGKQRGNIDLLVTPEHTMLVRKRMYVGGGRESAKYEWSDWRGVRAEEVAGKTTYRYKRSAARNLSTTPIPPEVDPWGLSHVDMHAFGRLCGFFVGDGYAGGRQAGYLSFNIRKEREQRFLLGFERDLNLKVRRSRSGCCHVHLKGARDWARRFFYHPTETVPSGKPAKTIPEWVLLAPEMFVRGFLEGLRNSDGSTLTEESWSYASSSKPVMEGLQILGTLWGTPVSVRGPYNDQGVGVAFVSGPKCQEPVINRNDPEDGWEDYDGEVYCATTSTGFLVVRRNYATVVSGNSSVMELTGSPTVGVEGVSWFTAWLLFDSPLVAGQEFSTRAVRRTDWPMARESYREDALASSILQAEDERILREVGGADIDLTGFVSPPILTPIPALAELHREWLEVYEAEVAWWTEHLADPANRAALGIADKEPFRPALDRARWALPGTFATGAAFASHVRERARTLRDASHVNRGTPSGVWADIGTAYRAAVPGLAQYGLREAVVDGDRDLPGHLRSILCPVPGNEHPSGVDVDLRVCDWSWEAGVYPYARTRDRSYADPWFNRMVHVRVSIECSLAVARDWHRHRTMYPWHLGVVVRGNAISLDRRYEPKSPTAVSRTSDLLRRSHDLYRGFHDAGDVERAALALPMGTRVVVSGVGGLRDVLYTLELRAHAHGANFEYREQAEAALYLLETRARLSFLPGPDWSDDEDPTVFDAVGYKPDGK